MSNESAPESERAFWQSIYDLDAEDFYNPDDSAALLDVVAAAAFLGLPIPKWAAQLFIRKISAKNSLEHSSWEEVFGPLHPPGTRLDSLRAHRKYGAIVFEQVTSLVSNGMPITEAFEEIGKGPLPVGEAMAAKLYYNRLRVLRAINEILQRE